MDERTRRRLDELAKQRKAIDDEEEQLIRLALAEMHRRAGVTKADEATVIALHNITESGTLGTQMQVEKSWGAAIAAAKRKPKWPFSRALDKAGISLPEWARKNGAKVENAKSWLKKPGKGGRPVPRVWAERIAKEFPSVRAVNESWPNGIGA